MGQAENYCQLCARKVHAFRHVVTISRRLKLLDWGLCGACANLLFEVITGAGERCWDQSLVTPSVQPDPHAALQEALAQVERPGKDGAS